MNIEKRSLRLRWLTRTSILLALTLAVQMLGLGQWVTGPAVNAMLIISAAFTGVGGAVIIGALTPLIAFLRGILPAPLGPIIPFIMLGNAVLVISYAVSKRVINSSLPGSITGVIIGSILKFLVLSTAVRFIVEVPPPVAQIMQVPQLFTALIGGIIAIAIITTIGKNYINENH